MKEEEFAFGMNMSKPFAHSKNLFQWSQYQKQTFNIGSWGHDHTQLSAWLWIPFGHVKHSQK